MFDFSNSAIEKVLNELKLAKKHIKMAVFQIHDDNIFNLLNQKIKEGVRVEIFTLPYDSIHPSVQNKVIPQFENLINNGGKVYFCKWNVGDPERTTTALGRWYLFHGKFIVTDKAAIALSANFTSIRELDAILIFKEQNKIDEFNKAFNELIDLFITNNNNYDGQIRKIIIETGIPDIENVFALPRVIETATHARHWIQHYPELILKKEDEIQEKLYISPLDYKARSLYGKIINEAEQFVHISSESFTDTDFSNVLIKTRMRNIKVKILAGVYSQDFSDRIQRMFRQLLAHEIELHTTKEDLHAKLLITEKYLVVGSVNLNKINLGFKKNQLFWRSNVESMMVIKNKDLINQAKIKYDENFNNAYAIEDILAEKIKMELGKLFTSKLRLKSKSEVKKLFAKLIIKKEVEVTKTIYRIGKLIKKLMQLFGKTTVEENDFLLALILYYLSERKHEVHEVKEKLIEIKEDIDISGLIETLLKYNLIEKEQEYYKIKLETLLS